MRGVHMCVHTCADAGDKGTVRVLTEEISKEASAPATFLISLKIYRWVRDRTLCSLFQNHQASLFTVV